MDIFYIQLMTKIPERYRVILVVLEARQRIIL